MFALTRCFLAAVTAVLLGCGEKRLADAVPPTIAVEPTANQPIFKLAIVPTPGYPQEESRTIYATSSGAFYVVLTNVSKEPQRIFEDWSSWGYWSLSFEAEKETGEVVKIEKGRSSVSFTRNFPAVFSIPPGGHYVFEVNFDKLTWPAITNEIRVDTVAIERAWGTVQFKAVFTQNDDEDAIKHRVWIGQVASAPEPIIIWR